MGHFSRIVSEPQGQPLRQWINDIPQNGLIRYLDFFNTERIAVFGFTALADVLVHKAYDFVKPPQFARGLGSIFGIGLFLAEGEEHKRQRRNLLPAFSYRHIKDLHPAFWSKSQELVTSLSRHIQYDENREIDVDDWVSRATLDIIGLAAFGHDFQTIQYPSGVLAETYRKILSPNRWSQLLGFLSFFLPPWFWSLLPIQHTGELVKGSNIIKGICRQMIRARTEELGFRTHPNRDILSIAIASGAFSEEDLVNQLMTFLVAGHETTTAAMGWSLYELCRNPSIQHRIRDEIRTHIPAQPFNHRHADRRNEDGKEFQATYIDRCTYLQAFCSEILRLYPPIPLTMRVAARDTTISDTRIPKGTTIILAPWAVNTSIELWGKDAHVFRPERWLSSSPTCTANQRFHRLSTKNAVQRPLPLERQKSIGPDTPYAFLTFLGGPRSCIGQSFARAELVCLVAAWVGAFETEFARVVEAGGCVDKGGLVNGVEVVTGISARPGSLKVRVRGVRSI
ncbi:MAG: hypothetical protein Q9188_001274 [Gyalolechia gomerana]